MTVAAPRGMVVEADEEEQEEKAEIAGAPELPSMAGEGERSWRWEDAANVRWMPYWKQTGLETYI